MCKKYKDPLQTHLTTNYRRIRNFIAQYYSIFTKYMLITWKIGKNKIYNFWLPVQLP